MMRARIDSILSVNFSSYIFELKQVSRSIPKSISGLSPASPVR